MNSLPGFTNLSEPLEIKNSKKKGGRKGGGFQCMGLSFNVLNGITHRGYQQPTPIQRKTIPLILEGRDVVAMARTGSGKTASFLIPMLEKLKARSAKAGARALILSPTRELALQTLKFIKCLGRFLDLKSAVILGGDSMDEQFAAIHGNPDIIVATPGRFLHVCLEMELKMSSVEYVVFDEADRLFEMGLGEQLTEICHRLPDMRQTLLFSATLPKVLVEFAKAGLHDPVLLRLDVESKIPDELQLWFTTVRPEERVSALLVLFKTCIDPDQQTIIFAATRHHVEYLHMILERIGVTNTYIYSNLEPAARKINAAKFALGKVKVMVVTDVAARGIDVPQLDNVVNYNFPTKPKLFVHRVGRCARAGRSGVAYSLVGPDEYAHLLDLHLFLGRPLSVVEGNETGGTIGKMPQSLLEEQHGALLALHRDQIDVANMKKVSENAYQQYIRSRPAASSDSNRRAKELPFFKCGIHPLFKDHQDYIEKERESVLTQMKSYRPQGTIFEICGKNKSQEYQTMKQKRLSHKEKINNYHDKQGKEKFETESLRSINETSSLEDVNAAFETVILPKKRKLQDLYKKSRKKRTENEGFIPYLPADRHTEVGLAVNNFQSEANKAQLDLTQDSEYHAKRSVQSRKWDRKKKKMVAIADHRMGKIQTESGVWIPATYKGDRYARWREKSKVDQNCDDETGGESRSKNATHWARHNKKMEMKQRKSELKTTEEILKTRKIAQKKNKQKRKGRKSKK